MDKISMEAARVAAKLSQAECAEKMGITREWYGKLERGEAPIQTYMLYAFACVTGFSVDNISLPTKSSKSEQ